jgi:triphosphoribosyl-dephospho-CoA synthetase
MINNIYELENGRQYVVIAEENIDNKKYVLVMECNYEKDEINEDLLLKLVATNGDGIVFKNVDEETANRVLPVLLSKYQK